MDWPTWSDVFPLLATVAGLLATMLAGLWALGRMFRLWMRAEAREAADTVSAEVKALADKFSTNDFPHIEAKIESVAATARTDREAMETRIGERLDRMDVRTETCLRRMEARILEAVRERAPLPEAPSPPVSPGG